jgi:hypothetical protein
MSDVDDGQRALEQLPLEITARTVTLKTYIDLVRSQERARAFYRVTEYLAGKEGDDFGGVMVFPDELLPIICPGAPDA